MGVPILIEGESGSGKSFAIKGLPPNETGIFSVEKGRLPFKGDFKVKKRATYKDINSIFKDPKLKRYVIDDSQYLMVNALFDRAKETGYQKYTDLALDFRNLIHNVNYALPDDVIVYFLHHTETDPNTGKVKAKTVGKMIDQYLTLEGCFDIVLLTAMVITSSRSRTAIPRRSPLRGCFLPSRLPTTLVMLTNASVNTGGCDGNRNCLCELHKAHSGNQFHRRFHLLCALPPTGNLRKKAVQKDR